MLTQERDKVLDTLKQMPGIVKQHQEISTPKKDKKNSLVKQTPTPKSRLKKKFISNSHPTYIYINVYPCTRFPGENMYVKNG